MWGGQGGGAREEASVDTGVVCRGRSTVGDGVLKGEWSVGAVECLCRERVSMQEGTVGAEGGLSGGAVWGQVGGGRGLCVGEVYGGEAV